MTRLHLIEMLRRQVYGSFPVDESDITNSLVNYWMNQGIAIAARKNYTDNYQLDGVAYINNSFYSTFKGLVITNDEDSLYKLTLPQIPIGVGSVDGISRVVFKDANNNISLPAVLLSENQVSIQRSMRVIPNKILCYPEGIFLYIITELVMRHFTATVSMVSGGDSANLNSVLNVPDDHIPVIVEFVKAQVVFQRQQPVDAANDGQAAVRTT